jgi:SAM-dependent methyltransferase
MSETPLFDVYAESYDEALNHALAVTGEDKNYFSNGRLDWVRHCLANLGAQPRRGMDYGCGNGSSTPLLASTLKLDEVVGVDVATRIIAKAREQYESRAVHFRTVAEDIDTARFDIAYCNGVFHHIPPAERSAAVDYVFRGLRPGGLFAFWENSPWSPAARYVMARCAFDEDAQMLSPREARRLLRNAGFEIVSTDFLFIFPEFLKAFRRLEPAICKLPFGAQYQVLARKQPTE